MKRPVFGLIIVLVTHCCKQPERVGVAKSFDDVPIVYEVYGKQTDAPTLFFVHGWSCDRSYWREQLAFFGEDYQVVAIDLGGHGESGLQREVWTIRSFGKDVAAVIADLDLSNVILIGHSMGGDVIADAALEVRDRISALVMVDTYTQLNAGRSPESIRAFVNNFRSHFADSVRAFVPRMFLPDSDSSFVAAIADDMASAPPVVALAAMESSFLHSREIVDDLKKLDLPTVAFNASYEPTDTATMNAFGVDVVVVPNTGHFMMLEDPARFNEMLSPIIKKFSQAE